MQEQSYFITNLEEISRLPVGVSINAPYGRTGDGAMFRFEAAGHTPDGWFLDTGVQPVSERPLFDGEMPWQTFVGGFSAEAGMHETRAVPPSEMGTCPFPGSTTSYDLADNAGNKTTVSYDGRIAALETPVPMEVWNRDTYLQACQRHNDMAGRFIAGLKPLL